MGSGLSFQPLKARGQKARGINSCGDQRQGGWAASCCTVKPSAVKLRPAPGSVHMPPAAPAGAQQHSRIRLRRSPGCCRRQCSPCTTQGGARSPLARGCQRNPPGREVRVCLHGQERAQWRGERCCTMLGTRRLPNPGTQMQAPPFASAHLQQGFSCQQDASSLSLQPKALCVPPSLVPPCSN